MKNGNTERSIECPKCGATIDVSALLAHQIEEGLKKDFDARLAGEKRKFDEQAASLEVERRAVGEAQKRLGADIERGVEQRIAAERKQMEDRIRRTFEEENSGRLKSMQDELAQKSEQVKDLHRTKSEVERLRREKDELKDSIEAEYQKKMNDQLADERTRIQKSADEKAQMRLSEKENIIEQLRNQLQEAQRKADQGSMQLQGEVQELAIEEWLTDSFPLDTIGEIKKGARGADCLHTVNTRTRQNCGSIYYESKRTKDFQPGWIEKFKTDMRAKGANIGVIVTEAMPRDMDRMGLKDGVWICSFEEFKGLSAVLRESIIQISNAVVAQENRGDKMTMLYDYLTSNEFRMQIEAIVEGFAQMQTDLNTEKRAMESSWKKREKQIEKVLLNTNHMFSSIKGIAGAAIAAVPLLEFRPEGGDPET